MMPKPVSGTSLRMLGLASGVLLMLFSSRACAQRMVADHALGYQASHIAINAEGTRITYLVGFSRIEQLDVASGRRTVLHKFHPCCDTGWESNVVLAPSGQWVAAAGNKTLAILAQPSGSLIDTVTSPGSDFVSLTPSPGSDRIAGAGQGFSGLGIWDIASGRLLRRLGAGRETFMSQLAWSPTGNYLAQAGLGRDSSVVLWNPESGDSVGVLRGARRWTARLSFSPDGKRLAAIGVGRTLICWDPKTRKRLWTFEPRDSGLGFILSYSPDGRSILVSNSGESLILVDATTGRELRRWVAHDKRGVMDAKFCSGRPLVASSGYDTRLRLWDLSEIVGHLH